MMNIPTSGPSTKPANPIVPQHIVVAIVRFTAGPFVLSALAVATVWVGGGV